MAEPKPLITLNDLIPYSENVGAGSVTARQLHPRTPVLSLDDVNFMLGTGLSANMALQAVKAQADGKSEQRDAWTGAAVGGLLNAVLARRKFEHRRGEGAAATIGKTLVQSGLPGAVAGAGTALALRALIKNSSDSATKAAEAKGTMVKFANPNAPGFFDNVLGGLQSSHGQLTPRTIEPNGYLSPGYDAANAAIASRYTRPYRAPAGDAFQPGPWNAGAMQPPTLDADTLSPVAPAPRNIEPNGYLSPGYDAAGAANAARFTRPYRAPDHGAYAPGPWDPNFKAAMVKRAEEQTPGFLGNALNQFKSFYDKQTPDTRNAILGAGIGGGLGLARGLWNGSPISGALGGAALGGLGGYYLPQLYNQFTAPAPVPYRGGYPGYPEYQAPTPNTEPFGYLRPGYDAAGAAHVAHISKTNNPWRSPWMQGAVEPGPWRSGMPGFYSPGQGPWRSDVLPGFQPPEPRNPYAMATPQQQ